jgi:methylmalonyl-CoA mutase
MSKTGNKSGLFGEFDPSSKTDWITKATADLKGADFSKRLVWKNLNDIEIYPFYTLEDRKQTLENTGSNSTGVINYRRIPRKAKNKNELALKAISEGLSGIVFEIGSTDRIENLLEGMDPERVTISYCLGADKREFVHMVSDFYKKSGFKASAVHGYLEIPVLSEYLCTGRIQDSALDELASACLAFKEYPRFKTLVASGREYMDSGSNQTQEIAFTLNSIVFLAEELKHRGVKEKLIFDSLQIILATGSEYFLEIAKLRAFKSLLHLVAEKYGVSDPDPALLSRSSIWTKSVLDAHTNMLRATTETMSALLGNSQAIEIDPYDKEIGNSKDLPRRIAGNIATILQEESYFGKVRNPADGSYYIEELTHKLATKALGLFKEIESAGGFKEAMEKEVIQNSIALVRTTKLKLISRRRNALVGVNQYPNLMEKLPADVFQKEEASSNPKFLRPRRAGYEVELIRSNTERLVAKKGHRPTVEFAGYGKLAMRKARAGFAFDFLGVGGFTMLEDRSYASAVEAAESSARSGSDIVVICSSDEDYNETALDFVKAFRALNDSAILLLAGNPADIFEKLKDAGLDACIHMRSDIIDTMNFIHLRLEKI